MQLSSSVSTYHASYAARHQRLPFRLPVPAKRFRVHISNYNDATNMAFEVPDLRISHPIYVGEHMLGADSEMTGHIKPGTIRLANDTRTVPLPDGEEYVGPWIDTPLEANTPYLLSYSIQNPSTQQFMAGMSYGWGSSDVNDVSVEGPAVRLRGARQSMLNVWLEVEIDASVPTLAWLGDSLVVGMRSNAELHDSVAWVHAMNHRVMPRIHAIGGSRLHQWAAAAGQPRWTRYASLGKCDAAVLEVGGNDVFDYRNRPSILVNILKNRLASVMPPARRYLSDRIFLTTVMPRSNFEYSPEFLAAVNEYNDYLYTLPHGAAGVIDFHEAVEDPARPGFLSPRYAADDLIHLHSGGQVRLAAAIPGQIATR